MTTRNHSRLRERRYNDSAGNYARRKTIANRGRPIGEALESRLLMSTYTVTSLSDPAPQSKIMTLRLAVTLADEHQGANTINFSPSLFSTSAQKTITLTQGDLVLSNSSGPITITGPGSSELAISGKAASRIFEVTSVASASISGLTIEDGHATPEVVNKGTIEAGGGILNAGSLTLSNDDLKNNAAMGAASDGAAGVAEGGAIYTTGKLSVSGCTLSGNSATGEGVRADPVTGRLDPGESAFGGAIAGSSAASITIASSTLTSDSANGGNDDVYDYDSAPAGNAEGGAISSLGKLTVTSSTLSGNTATGGNNADYPIVESAAGFARGGAIFAVSLTIASSTLDSNKADGGFQTYVVPGYVPGAGGEGAGGALYTTGTTAVSSCALTNNSSSSGESGAAIDTQTNPSEPAIGGAIACAGGSLTVSQSTVSGNAAVGGAGETADASYGIAGGIAAGGGIWTDVTTTISASSIFANTVTGGLAQEAANTAHTPSGNGGEAQGAGIYCSASTTVVNSTIANNTATGGQAGGANPASDPPSAAGTGGAAQGGGIYSASTFDLYDSTVSGNNTVAGQGGAGSDTSPYPAQKAGSPGISNGSGLFSAETASLLDNSIISANVSAVPGHRSIYNDIAGVNASSKSAYNFIGVGGGLTNGVNGNKIGSDSPDLGALANNGGPTETMMPIAGIPVIDAGSNSLIPSGVTTDQRGMPRIFNGTVDIGAVEFSTTVIGGAVFNDVNGDGVRQSSEPGLAKVQVFDDVNDVGYYVSGDPTAITNSDGDYSLTVALTPGHTSIIIRETRPTDERRTEPAGIYPLGFYSLTPTTATVNNITFGDSATALVTGSVFHDTNKDGKHQGGEADLGGWTIEVDQDVDKVWKNDVHSAVTNSDGVYSIVLAAGTYRLHDVLKSGLKPTIPSTGVLAVTLTMGGTVTGQDFGND